MSGGEDWQCPNTACINHEKKVFGSKATCPKCGSSKEDFPQRNGEWGQKGMKGGDMPDDWPCPNTACMNADKLVFGKNASCTLCGAARNAKSPGDWLCPNTTCVNNKNCVFASKTTCPKCHTPRPGSRGQPMPMPAMMPMFAPVPGPRTAPHMKQAMMQQMQQAMMQQMRQSFMGGAVVNGASNGDWKCPNPSCMNNTRLVFGKHASCPQCGEAKPAQRAAGKGASTMGDWQCPSVDCKNHKNKVFGKHAQCPSCGAENPEAVGSKLGRDARSRSPYGRIGA